MKQMRLTSDHQVTLFDTHVVIPKGTTVDVVIEDVTDCEVIVQTGNGKITTWIEKYELQPRCYYHLVETTVSKIGCPSTLEEYGNLTKDELEIKFRKISQIKELPDTEFTTTESFKDCVVIWHSWVTKAKI